MTVFNLSAIFAKHADAIQTAAASHPAVPFDGRVVLAASVLDVAREQAERVFLILDGTPPCERDLGEAERLIRSAGAEVLLGWGQIMATFGSDAEPWAKQAADAAAKAYHDRLDELAPGLHAGGRA